MARSQSAVRKSIQSKARAGRRKLSLSPEVSVELLLNGRSVLGLGAVEVCSGPLRCGAVPLRPDFPTPDAIP